MPSLKRKKRTFTLIEVLISIALATTCAFFLLQYQKAHIDKTKEASLKLIQEQCLQEASVKLLERLYTNQIGWQMIQEEKSYDFDLKNPQWRAKCQFSLENSNTKIIADVMHVKAEVALLHKDSLVEKAQTTLYFCCTREGNVNAKK